MVVSPTRRRSVVMAHRLLVVSFYELNPRESARPCMLESIRSSNDVARLFCAAGVPGSLEGAGLVTRALVEVTAAAQRLMPSNAAREWHEVAKAAQERVSVFLNTDSPERVGLLTPPEGAVAAFSVLARWRSSLVTTDDLERVQALLGQALMISAAGQTPQPIPACLAHGCRTLNLAHRGSGKRAEVWDEILETDLLNLARVKHVQERAAATPAGEFVSAVVALLGSTPISPSLMVGSTSSQLATDQEPSVRSANSDEPLDKQTQAVAKRSDTKTQSELEPDVSARLQRADWAGPAEKLGLHDRDHFLTGDLAQITRNLATAVQTGSRRDKGFAAFAVLQLVTGCTDMIAAKLELCPRYSIWLDVDKSCWAWDFSAYRDALGPAGGRSRDVEPVYCPWPALIDPLIQAAAAKNPPPSNLGELIALIQGEEELDIEDFRRFLIRCGNSAQPAYRGRFARSLASVYLEVTGSDMVAALLTCSFAATAPSSLAYFGPRY